jgi:GntR family transcriptional regulator
MGRRHIAQNVEAELRSLIAERFGPGAQLPAERELAEMLEVSRPTLREVVSSMCRTGELDRRWGVGTFVAATTRRLEVVLGDPPGPMRVAALAQGLEAEFASYSTELVVCPSDSLDILGLGPDDLVWRINRVLIVDGRPALRMTDVVPGRIPSAQLVLTGVGKGDAVDLIPYLSNEFGLDITYLNARLGVRIATLDDARHLHIETGSPLLVSRIVGRTDDDLVLLHGEVAYVPGRVEIVVTGVAARPVDAPENPPPNQQP